MNDARRLDSCLRSTAVLRRSSTRRMVSMGAVLILAACSKSGGGNARLDCSQLAGGERMRLIYTTVHAGPDSVWGACCAVLATYGVEFRPFSGDCENAHFWYGKFKAHVQVAMRAESRCDIYAGTTGTDEDDRQLMKEILDGQRAKGNAYEEKDFKAEDERSKAEWRRLEDEYPRLSEWRHRQEK